jgi:hypothetical protein
VSESELQHGLLSDLAKVRDFMRGSIKNRGEFYYEGMQDFILREGQFFEPRPLPAGIDYMEIKRCYQNAFQTALEERFVYVEGYALSAFHGLHLHAWNLDPDGFVVDRTWNPHGRVYFGVIFPLEFVPRKSGKQYPVIDDWEHGFPILRKPWDKEAARKTALEELSLPVIQKQCRQ